ncbi:MAG: aminotransferase class IV [Mangrovibacterium sp.]
MVEHFTLYHKNFYKDSEPFLTGDLLQSRLFDVEMKLANTKLLFWNDYQEIIIVNARLFGMEIANPMPLMKDIKRQIQRTYVKNKCYKGVIVRLTFFRVEGNLVYMVELNHVTPYIYEEQVEAMELMPNGRILKSKTLLSSLEIGSRDLWFMAQTQCKKSHHLALIMNEQELFLEVPRANIFLITKEMKVKTPHASLGVCVNPARLHLFHVLEDMGYDVEESLNLTFADLQQAEEVFVVDDLHGVRFVGAFKNVRYYRKEVKKIAEEFVRSLEI